MNPAAPVINAFMRRPPESAPAAGTACRSMSSAACTVLPDAAAVDCVGNRHFVAELHPHRRQQPPLRPDLQLVVVARRPRVLAVRFDHRQRHAGLLHLAIAPAERPQQVGARHLEPHEVVGVVDDAHLVGFRVADADGSRWRTGTTFTWPRAPVDCGSELASRRCRIGAAEDRPGRPRGCRRPAATTRAAFAASMPPSISMSALAPRAVEQLADRPHFRLAARDKGLAAEAGVHRHHQHVVEVAGDRLRASPPASTG